MNSKLPIVAAFDFDGTITYRDSLLPFLNFISGKPLSALNLTLLLPQFTGFLFGFLNHQDIKEALLKKFIFAREYEEIKNFGIAYAKQTLPTLVRPEAMDRLLWHQKQGHRCLLVSANLDLYLEPWGQTHGFDKVICSKCEVSNGLITGRLDGKNCRGFEKVRRLNEAMGSRDSYTLYAYGNSQGDKELLDTSDYPFYCRFK